MADEDQYLPVSIEIGVSSVPVPVSFNFFASSVEGSYHSITISVVSSIELPGVTPFPSPAL